MSRIGADIGRMEDLEGTFRTEGGTCRDMIDKLNRAATDSVGFWDGPAADKFRDAWNSQFKPALDKLHAALGEAETEVKNRKEAIRQAGS